MFIIYINSPLLETIILMWSLHYSWLTLLPVEILPQLCMQMILSISILTALSYSTTQMMIHSLFLSSADITNLCNIHYSSLMEHKDGDFLLMNKDIYTKSHPMGMVQKLTSDQQSVFALQLFDIRIPL